MMLQINVPLVEEIIKKVGGKTELAKKLGISRMQLDRVLSGDSIPGTKVISAFLETFPECGFNKLFFLPNALQNSNSNRRAANS